MSVGEFASGTTLSPAGLSKAQGFLVRSLVAAPSESFLKLGTVTLEAGGT